MHFLGLTRRLFATGIGLSLLLLAVGCQQDRFNDRGCVSDQECHGDRICENSRCVSPNGLGDEQTDAGTDTGPDAPHHDIETPVDPEPDVIQRFVGMWDTTASGEVRQPTGEVEQLEDERVRLRITEAESFDLRIELYEAGDTCPLFATVSGENIVLEDEPCTISEGEMTVTYSDTAGRGSINAQGVLTLTYATDAILELAGEREMTANLDLTFRGQRVDD